MNAESSYLFRHALLRDAAYQLQLPGDRARLHATAFAVIEDQCGGRPSDAAGAGPVDGFALELAEHAGKARLTDAQRLYLRRAAVHAGNRFQNALAERLFREVAGLLDGGERAEALRRSGHIAYRAGRWKSAEASHLCDFARFLVSRGRVEEARPRWARGSALFEELGDARERANQAQRMKEVCDKAGVAPFEVDAPVTARAPAPASSPRAPSATSPPRPS